MIAIMFFFRRLHPQPRKSRPAATARKVAVRRLPLSLEVLETRVLLSTDVWINPNGGLWDVNSNWSLGHAPGSGDTANISTRAAVTITIQSGDAIQVQSINAGSRDLLAIAGGTVTLTNCNSILKGGLSMTGGSLTADAPVSLYGNSNWVSGFIDAVGGLAIAPYSRVTLPGGAGVTLGGTVTNNGTIELAPAGGNVNLSWSGGLALGGRGQVLMDASSGGYSSSFQSADGSTLTILAPEKLLCAGTASLGGGSGTVVNQGLVEATGPGGLLDLDPASLTNGGMVAAFGGAEMEVQAPVNNAGGVVAANASTLFNASTITGGSVQLTHGATVNGGGTLANVTIPVGTDLLLNLADPLVLSGTVTNNGTIELNPTGGTVTLSWSGGLTLAGVGRVLLDASSGGFHSYFQAADSSTLTIAAGQTVLAEGNDLLGY
jgi:hypothetical protein